MTYPVCSSEVKLCAEDYKTYFYEKCQVCNHCLTYMNAIIKPEDYLDEKHSNWFNNPNFTLFKDILNVDCDNNELSDKRIIYLGSRSLYGNILSGKNC